MEAIGQYVLRLVCGAIICSCLMALCAAGSTGKMLRMLCGMYLVYLALSPLMGFDALIPDADWGALQDEAQFFSSSGQTQAENALTAVIKERTEAYILDEAESLQTQLQVRVEIDSQTQRPISVCLEGKITPYAKQVLSDYLTNELGIQKEDQHWTQ